MKKIAQLNNSKQFGPRVIYDVPLDETLPWNGNPPGRTTETALKKLGETMTPETGQLVPGSGVIVETRDGRRVVIVDAHRRREENLKMGAKSMEIIIYTDITDTSSEEFGELFKSLNNGTRSLKQRDLIEVVLNGDDAATQAVGDATIQKLVEKARSTLNDAALARYKEHHCPNSALNYCISAGRALVANEIIQQKEFKTFVSKALNWVLDHNNHFALKLKLAEANDIPAADRAKLVKLLTRMEEDIRGNRSSFRGLGGGVKKA